MKIATHTTGECSELQRAERAIAEADLLDKIQELRRHSENVRRHAKNAHLGLCFHNLAMELRLRAERLAGTLLAEFHLRGGDHRSPARAATLKLSDLRIDRNESARLQQEAAVPEAPLFEYLQRTTAVGGKPSSAGLLRIGKQLRAAGGDRYRGSEKSRKADGALSTARRAAASKTARKSADFESQLADARSDLSELRNHYGQLARLLKPLCESNRAKLEVAVQNQISRLLADSAGLLQQLHARLKRLARLQDCGS